MDRIAGTYTSFASSVSTLGRVLLVPYVFLRVILQFAHYNTLNALSYTKLFILYHYNMIFMINGAREDDLTFRESWEQKKRFNVVRTYNETRPVAEDVKAWFESPALQAIPGITWRRTAYYYERYVIHAPICTLRKLPFVPKKTGSYLFDPHSNSTPSADKDGQLLERESRFPNSDAIRDSSRVIAPRVKSDFTPKSYILSSESVRQTHDSGHLVSQTVPIKSPSITKLFDQPAEAPPPSPTPVPKEQQVIEDRPIKSSDSNSSFFYKIRIRRKNKPQDPTYGNYELVRQAIRDCLPKPDYDDGSIGPNIVRFTWHCCAHFDRESGTGGCNGGTMRFAQEFNDPGNTGLHTAKSYLDQIHEKYPWISFADLYTLGGVVAIEAMGGPKIEWKPGRTDCPDSNKVPPMGRLPVATKDTEHLHEVFTQRLGFNDQELVALIGGGHTLGGCHVKFSGFDGSWTSNPVKFDNEFFRVLLEDTWNFEKVPLTGMPQYYNSDHSLMMLITDIELIKNPTFKYWVEVYARDSELFMRDFASAFAKLLELGVNRDPDGIARTKI
ncbi:hypothetical protein KL939_000273 [Ogataea angusta]|nr:hypothetical protein KL939_000273 [Ogataea angusta]